jgi:hypothetical protein
MSLHYFLELLHIENHRNSSATMSSSSTGTEVDKMATSVSQQQSCKRGCANRRRGEAGLSKTCCDGKFWISFLTEVYTC